MEKLQSLTFQKIAHLITAVDCQPMFDGGILVNVLGQLKVKTGWGNMYFNMLVWLVWHGRFTYPSKFRGLYSL